jgi:hypothetical protein
LVGTNCPATLKISSRSFLRRIASIRPNLVDFRRLVMGGKVLPEDAVAVGIGGGSLANRVRPFRMVLGDSLIAIHHVGSTTIPHIYAKII